MCKDSYHIFFFFYEKIYIHELENLVRYGQIAMQLHKRSVCHFILIECVSAKILLIIFIITKVLWLLSLSSPLVWTNCNLVYLIDTVIWHETSWLRYFIQGSRHLMRVLLYTFSTGFHSKQIKHGKVSVMSLVSEETVLKKRGWNSELHA